MPRWERRSHLCLLQSMLPPTWRLWPFKPRAQTTPSSSSCSCSAFIHNSDKSSWDGYFQGGGRQSRSTRKKERKRQKEKTTNKHVSSANLAPAIQGGLVQSSSMWSGRQPSSWEAVAAGCWEDSWVSNTWEENPVSLQSSSSKKVAH